ncbi:EAL domain-containing protein [Sphingomonas sabuli]|uniref:EAL domain-containing protein n=1 Tax=Sphingomonas sabuli TaxID=2764186 RepID=A0A7G9L3D0_9SPHN|nr:EAL domain-containing protein [Sphingomonas sabuli]QNM83129.1 EAL domain-containing protein [Sphingomonas sabuli]
MRTHEKSPSGSRPWRTLLWIAIAGLIFGALGAGEIAEDPLRGTRNRFHMHKASGDIVVVKMDEAANTLVGRIPPWPRSDYARMTDALTKAGAKRILFDVKFYGKTSPAEDRAFADALRRSGRATLAVRGPSRSGREGRDLELPPLPEFAEHAGLGSINWYYNYQNAVWDLPFAAKTAGGVIPSFSAILSGQRGGVGESFPVDYSIDPTSIPTVSAADVLRGDNLAARIAGKDVLIGTTTDSGGDMYFVPGVGQMGGVFIHAVGAETLRAGRPVDAGWVPAFLLALLLSGYALVRARERQQLLLAAAGVALVLLAPVALESRLIFVDMVPALFVMILTSSVLLRWRFNRRGLVDPISGLPNLTALKSYRGRDQALIVARILNYAEVVAALPPNSESSLVDQIVTRLSVGAPERTFFQGDDGIFAWFDEPGKPFGHHLEALHALFRTPVRVNGMSIDLSVSFGVEIGSGRSMANRLGSALLAAEEAAHDGLKWKYHDPDSLQDASWKLSMLSQLDEAVDRGEVWVAFQPKVDLKSRRIIGAEALARWTHPEKGPIAAAEFVAAAEQNDRIGKLTAFVLDRSIGFAAGLTRGGREFDMSVNLSGRLLSDKALVGRIAILLERHGLEARHLTLELTETAAIAGSGNALDMLIQLRELGVNISIDDYGTGLSTLDYLKKVPASEIKIDQSFVRGMVENRSERLMVASTIALAHSLGRQVVAEGVETREALDILAEMECDIVQGYITGRPMSMDSLRRRLSSERSARVA